MSLISDILATSIRSDNVNEDNYAWYNTCIGLLKYEIRS